MEQWSNKTKNKMIDPEFNRLQISYSLDIHQFVFLSKLYMKKFEEIELHALGDAISTSVKVANYLQKIQYVTITTTQIFSLALNPDVQKGKNKAKQIKMIIYLKKNIPNQIELGIEEKHQIQQLQKQLFERDDYLYQEKVNLAGTKKQDLHNFLKLTNPSKTVEFIKKQEETEKKIEKYSENEKNDLFIMKVLQKKLKDEKLDLIIKEQVTVVEEKCLQQLMTGGQNETNIIEMKFKETPELNFKKLKENKNEKDYFIKDFKIKIAKGYNSTYGYKITPDDVQIVKIEEGSIKIECVIKSSGRLQEFSQQEAEKIASNAGYNGYELNLHKFFKYCLLSSNQFDPRGNIDFTEVKAQTQERGGVIYIQPDQWKRYGLKVLGQYKHWLGYVDDTWLTDWGVNGWAVGYHGYSESRGANRTPKEKKATFAVNNIISQGLKPGAAQVFAGTLDIKTNNPITKGVYFAKNVEESAGYCSPIYFDGDSSHSYKVVFQCRLNPKAIQYTSDGTYVVENNKDIRPYGILLRKY